MRIKDLQIGDWVRAGNSFPMQVVGLFKDVAYLDFEGNEADMWEEKEEDIEPIPITPEILEKNGFAIGSYSFCDIGEGKFLEYYHHEFRLRLWWKGVDEYENHSLTKDLLGQCNVFCVHELQHALRLFGIDKEIVL